MMNMIILNKRATLLFSSLFFVVSLLKAQYTALMVIDKDYPNKTSLLASSPINVKILEVGDSATLWTKIHSTLSAEASITQTHLFLNTTESTITVGKDSLGLSDIESMTGLGLLKNLVTAARQIDLFLYSCSLAKNAQGLSLLNALGEQTNFNVLSASNCSTIFDGNFNFNFSSKNKLSQTHLILD
jgi:hypothetical protein